MRIQSVSATLLSILIMGVVPVSEAIASSIAPTDSAAPGTPVAQAPAATPPPSTCRRIGRDNLDLYTSQEISTPSGVRLANNVQISLVLAADGTIIRYRPAGRPERVLFNAAIPGMTNPLSGWVEASGLVLCGGGTTTPSPQTRACGRTTETLAILRSLNNANVPIATNPDYIGTLPNDTVVEFTGVAQAAPSGGTRQYRRIIRPTSAINYDQGGATVPLPTGTDWWIAVTGANSSVSNIATVPCP